MGVWASMFKTLAIMLSNVTIFGVYVQNSLRVEPGKIFTKQGLG